MNLEEFIKIYVNASDEVRSQIEETLDSFQTLPSCLEEEAHTVYKA